MQSDSHTTLTQSRLFFNNTHQIFLKTIESKKEIQQFYSIAGFNFCLKFATEALIDLLTPALNHLKIETGEHCDLTICLWDSVSTKSPSVKFPWTDHFYDLRGEVIQYNTEEIYTVVDIHTKALHVFDKSRNLALYWVKDSQDLPWWVKGSPLQLILHWWMRTKNHQLTHAAAIGYPEGGVVLAGKSGSGKSTTTLACMRAGMQYLSEDYCILNHSPQIWAYSIYNSAKIEDKTLEWFPELMSYVDNTQRAMNDKAFFFHHKFQPEKILLSCPIKALITLKIENIEESWMEPIQSDAMLGPLSVSTMWQLTHTGPVVFKHLKKITEILPCYQLHLGRNLTQIPPLIKNLL